ncbi:MAG: hypothetical protein Kow0096_08500 [Thiohalomonadaceae bacterium]
MDLDIQYIFRFADGREASLTIRLDATSLESTAPVADDTAAWTLLAFDRCSHCPLDEAVHRYCPLARSLVGTVAVLGDVLSYDRVQAEVVMPERRILCDTSAQNAISAMMGLIIATSGCPHMAFFKPMARFHLPFASEEETMYRAASMYLLGQYFRQQQGLPTELGFEGLVTLYHNVEIVNRAMANRLRAAAREDGTVNALVLLDMYAKTLPTVVEETLQELRPLYTAYL